MPNDKTGIGKGSTNTATGSPGAQAVAGKPSVTITYRLFAAEQTAKLDPQTRGQGPSRDLKGLPLVLGVVEGGKLKAFTEKIRGAPVGVRKAGKYTKGAFLSLSSEDQANRTQARNKLNDKGLSAEQRKQLQAEYQKNFGNVHEDILVHVMPLPGRIAPGTTVGVCISVDAKQSYRRLPLWQVTAGDHDIVVDVFETYGKHALDDHATLAETVNEGSEQAPKLVDYYKAQLSGDIWMRSTHPFKESDVEALPTDAATPAVRQALAKIYRNEFTSVGADFAIDVPRQRDANDKAAVRLLWISAENDNCVHNVSALDIRRDIPPRIHPGAYAAVARAAHEAGVDEVRFTSSWRPMLGSMPHRTGQGLDLKWLVEGKKALMLNRTGLSSLSVTDKNKDGKVDDPRGHGNITVQEQQAFNDWRSAQRKTRDATSALTAAKAKLDEKTKALASAKKAKNTDQTAEAEHALQTATKERDEAADALADAQADEVKCKKKWTDELAANEPGVVGNYRRYLMREQIVTQVIDPWYLEMDARRNAALVPNEQLKDGTQDIHATHMHISIADPELS